jgi:hypothetical protein
MADQRAKKPTETDAAAVYLTTMLEELVGVAERNRLPLVAYLLDMALLELRSASGQSIKTIVRSRRRQ